MLDNALIQREKLLLPSLHIKLGLMKQFMIALSQRIEACKCISLMFSNLSEAKVKGGIFGNKLDRCWHLKSWKTKCKTLKKCMASCSASNERVFGKKCEKYKELAENLLDCHRKQGCRM